MTTRQTMTWQKMAERNDQVLMLVYPEMTALDLVGPQYAFACTLGAKVHLVGQTREPVMTDTKFAIVPTMTFDEAPADPTVIFVPGGTTGTLAAIRDETTLSFVADRGARATYVTSVCTGSLVLAAAGLLSGYRATSHWAARDLLAAGGAEPVDARVVIDRNRITGAGVSAGLDFGLKLVAMMRDEAYARSVQLLAEYAPEPPFKAGTPAEAGPEITAPLLAMFEGFRRDAVLAVGAAAGRSR
ncbi:DJ-1/PfpI family protein [Phreatobacter stygius]|uniref:DJ-1/PfpI family protein n=2 Tax=Phreatobacter stygius TaxID=1940610 RepID=A0A4D7BEF0_9HYPH|nr:DJ-1/PfpI family protein [Phreatobacter stygius]